MLKRIKNQKLMSKKSQVGLIIVWIIFVFFMVSKNIFKSKASLSEFHGTEIHGIVSEIKAMKTTTLIKFKNDNRSIEIFTKYNEDLGFFFQRFVEIGDSIYKSKDDDFIYIYRVNDEFVFETKPILD